MKKKELLIVGALLALALLALLALKLAQKNDIKSGELYAEVTYDGAVAAEIDLAHDEVYHIDALLPVTLEVRGGEIRFLDSKCPDHVCEGFGFINEQYEYAVCMPARVIVMIERHS